MIKERLYYWGTVVPLTGMLLYVHAEYKDQQAIIDHQHKVSNRQIELMAESYTRLLNKQSEQFAKELIIREQHHREEVNEVITHAQDMIDEAKK
tara:strand:- start:66 stop:347 length:282 start_codon:yes stop_codon:yes gene_type:complete